MSSDPQQSRRQKGGQGSTRSERRVSDLNGHPVIEVEVRARPPGLRCTLAPHAIEVSILRPESRFHRLVFTLAEWETFLADVKEGLYDVVQVT